MLEDKMSTEKIKKELIWIRQFIHKQDDENVVIRDATGKDIASWIDRVDAAIATPPAAQREPDDSFDIDDVAYALEAILQRAGEGATVGHAIALLENLAKPEQEPVAWLVEFENGEQELHFDKQSVGETQAPLYTTPPAAQPAPVQEPVGNVVLRDGLATLLMSRDIKSTDQRLYTTPPAAPVQEPVAWEDVLGAIARGWAHPENARKPIDVQLAVAIAKEIQDMYTTPPAAPVQQGN
jgi:hypothetical protein